MNLLNIKHLLLVFLFFILFLPLKSFSQTIDFQQAQNGDPTAFPITFTNGILNATQTTYYEGLGIPQRLIFTGLDPAAAKYTVFFQFLAGIPNKGVHAYDMLMSWEQAVLTARKIGGAIVGAETQNELANLFSTACQNAPAACAALSDLSLPAANIKRPVVPDVPVAASGFYSGVDENITCFENTFGNRDIEIRGNAAISNAVLTFIGYDGDFANFKLEWTSASTNIMIRYASRAAVGDGGAANFACGYGVGHGAGSISGGNYHNIFQKLVKNNNTGNEIQGSRDNQLSAGAITPVSPPNCPTISPQSVCATATSIVYTVATPETGVTYNWTLTNGTTSAGAKLQGANGSGVFTGTTVTVVPVATSFTAGGTFSLNLTMVKSGVPDVNCPFTDIGTIVKVEASASASPTNIDITSTAHNTTLTADIDASSTDANNENYNYQWSIVTANTTGSLTNATSRVATYTAGALDLASIQFKVIATQKNSPSCSDDATTTVTTSSAGNCTVSSQAPVCAGTEVTHDGTPNPKPGTATYLWVLTAYGSDVGTTTSTFNTANGGVQIKVNAIESYRITLRQTYQNNDLSTACSQDVQVVAQPSVVTKYNPPGCSDKQFTVDVTNPVNGYTYTIRQPGSATPNTILATITPTAGSPTVHFTGLNNGDGFEVKVTTNVASCTAVSGCSNPSTGSSRLATNTESPDANKTTKAADLYNIKLVSPTKVNAVPNPYTDKIRFNLVSTISGMGSLELFNMLGQKVGVVYQGYVQAGQELTKEYFVSKEKRNTLIYVFKVGDQRVTGKLIGLK